MRENTERMQLPRFLWVPFELGRPFGAPHEPDFQRRVLHAALALLEREDGPVVLEDFTEDAPVPTTPDDGETWSCPVSFQPTSEGESDLLRETLAEISQLAPWHEVYVANGGRPAPPSSGMSHTDVVRGLGALVEERETPAASTDLPLIEWVRLGCDDVRSWYLESARARPGSVSAAPLNAWFWEQTALARLIARAAMVLTRSADPRLQIFARRSMVPRAHMRELMPGVEPSIGDLPGSSRNRT